MNLLNFRSLNHMVILSWCFSFFKFSSFHYWLKSSNHHKLNNRLLHTNWDADCGIVDADIIKDKLNADAQKWFDTFVSFFFAYKFICKQTVYCTTRRKSVLDTINWREHKLFGMPMIWYFRRQKCCHQYTNAYADFNIIFIKMRVDSTRNIRFQ